ncbi:hypothetical protein PLICRDRAFT_40528 [Plicaturopsis crispa FD-325 SS-3]|nr:hypothetical protein PLICRDRAFT_40528 [Plicaturopsis crispa FD-325 SS-3]
MTRRAAPTALRLIQGPTPPRGVPRHTMPSMPRPTFQPPAILVRGPAPRSRSGSPRHEDTHMLHSQLPPLAIPQGSSSYTSAAPPSSSSSPETSDGMRMRGPWDHSRSISVPFDVGTVLAPPKPVAVSPVW